MLDASSSFLLLFSTVNVLLLLPLKKDLIHPFIFLQEGNLIKSTGIIDYYL
ncbi:MAG: hypothetical protein ACFFD4_11030 [Candidatus Odinarchaeota archaeon]